MQTINNQSITKAKSMQSFEYSRIWKNATEKMMLRTTKNIWTKLYYFPRIATKLVQPCDAIDL